MSVLIKDGRIVTAADDYVADIYVEDETVTLIGESLDQPADKVIDATGKYVLPGCVDPHTHLDMPFGGTVTIDDVESGQTAAAFGGTTCHVDFIIQPHGTTFADAIEEWRGKANGKQVIDMGYHMAVTDLREGGSLEELASLPDQGVTSYKLFMAYKGALMVDDETLFKTMEVAAETGALVMVHAENGDAIDVLVKRALAEGHTEPRWHALTRPPETEGEATNRAFRLAEMAGGIPLYIVHLSSSQALEQVRLFRDRGLPAYAETCPQYLFLSIDNYDEPGFDGAKYVMSPPLREKWHQDELCKGLAKNDLQVVSTDHCPFCMKEGFQGLPKQKELGKGDFSKIPNGAPGVETRMVLLYDGGVVGKRITLNRWVELTSTTPAKLMGMFPKKGTIAVGSDADIVVWDPRTTSTISAKTHHMRVDYNPYEGRKVKGKASVVLSRGEVIVEKDEFLGKKGRGKFIKRGSPLLQT